jgi:hypothetical protein
MPEAPGSRSHASSTCAFCRIISGEEEASVVFEDSLSLAFLDHRPLFPGHCLLVRKRPLRDAARPSRLPGRPLVPERATVGTGHRRGLRGRWDVRCPQQRRQGNTSPTCISISCLATARMALKASSGPSNDTRMMRLSGRCRKRWARPASGSDLASSSAGANPFTQAILLGCRFSSCPCG